MAKSSVAVLEEVGMTNPNQIMFADLLTKQLEGIENTEVVVSITKVPPNTTLPKHWHPGEEFAYVLEGALTLWQESKPDEHYVKGDAAMIPLKQVHTISTQEEGATVVVFRVHESGQPGRMLVD